MGAFFMNCLLIKPVSPEFKMHQALYALENISSKRQKEFLFISKGKIKKDEATFYLPGSFCCLTVINYQAISLNPMALKMFLGQPKC